MYHTVRIRDLAPALLDDEDLQNINYQKYKTSSIPEGYWKQSIKYSLSYDRFNNFSNEVQYRQTHFETNGSHTHLIHTGHALFEAYLAAYNLHEDLLLSPDDIWLMITIYYSRYVSDNAEQMRHLFVEHEGKKELVVDVYTMTPDWPTFLIKVRDEIGKHVKNDIVNLLTGNFSTTGAIEELLSCTCIAHTFQKYFDYVHCVCGCGIRNVHFMGTLDDWKLLKKKTEELKKFTLPTSTQEHSVKDFRAYLDGVLPISDQFIRTYEGHVDNDFWDGIFDFTKIGVNGPSGIYQEVDAVHGWFLRLCFGYHLDDNKTKGVQLRDIGLGSISVPVKLVNLVNNTQSSCFIVGGFHGIHSSEDGKHRPVMSFAVFEKIEEKNNTSN